MDQSLRLRSVKYSVLGRDLLAAGRRASALRPGSMVFLMKRTEPSTNRKVGPAREGLPNPLGDRLSPARVAPVGRVAPGLESADRLRRP